MPNRDEALIPLTPELSNLEPAHKDFQLRVFSERRERVLGELRMLSGIPELASSLQPGTVYRLVIPEGTVLQQGKDGLYSGVIRADDRILKHARFEKLSTDFLHVASALGTQILLVSIAVQLNQVEQAVASLSEELHNDRLALVLGGARLYEDALLMKDSANRNRQILNAIQSLNVGFDQLRLELSKDIAALPDPASGFLDNWGVRSKADIAAEKVGRAEVTLRAALYGVSVLSECYAALDEPQAGAGAIRRCLADLQACGTEKAAHRARLVEVQNPRRKPETPWLDFDRVQRSFERAAQKTPFAIDVLEQGGITVEFEARELMEA